MQLDLYNLRLGKGYFGEVYYGMLDSEPIAAKKCLCVSSVYEEARLLQLCDHENIIKCNGVKECNGEPYLIMELAQAGTLEENLGNESFSTDAKKLLIQQICRGLHYLHGLSIVHRDIRAVNLLLKNVAPPHLVISDFGAAQNYVEGCFRPSDHDIVRDGVYSFKSDVFLVGLVAFQIFEDRASVCRETLAYDILARGLDVVTFTDARWRRAIVDSLNENPELRPSAIEFHDAFSH